MMDNRPGDAPRFSRGAQRSGDQVLDRVREALKGLRYGAVTVIVQDGVIVQVERTDRVRLPREAGK
jgi:hypothetical protein